MGEKHSQRVFDDAEAVRRFTLKQNRRVETWFLENWERLDGITGPIHKSTVSRALTSNPVVEPVAAAMDVLFEEMRDDPWEWCKPPEDVDDLTNYAPLNWWFKTLSPAMSWARFERAKAHPLVGDERELVQERFDTWRERLRAACDQFKEDRRLVRALEADMNPEYQVWADYGHGWQLAYSLEEADRSEKSVRKIKRRAGNPGLHGCTGEEIGLALALADATLTLPDVEGARLTYARPRVVPETDHISEPVEPWNGDEFDGVEVERISPKTDEHEFFKRYQKEGVESVRTLHFEFMHNVRYYWDGQRYQIEDVQKFVKMREVNFSGRAPTEWRDLTDAERLFFETGLIKEQETREEFLAQREEWIDMVLRESDSGRTREQVADQFEVVLDWIDDEAVLDEQREINRARLAFRRTLRRRA
ncbi:hypothetical protein [Roseobacter sp. OBYS 0001]|uniref:hypothetical protein n=1 Tax=Roseobacter sp. OBYS 0001 TaxID=882651 RepID=UPI001BB8B179|nr:hypothetical protein [Roseobacter sp. OBYS 0001]GIT86174.1 hypothetical protein ROBYS_11900 [Roseobacter sp. OBYS 0001]